jgi:hypothetical protein
MLVAILGLLPRLPGEVGRGYELGRWNPLLTPPLPGKR